jgi:two-component system response regulator YesN
MPYNILIAEDDRNVSNLIREIIERKGNTALIARDGAEAYKVFTSFKIDLVVTDLKMPNMDGMTLIDLIRQRDRRVPIIIVTGYGSEKNRALAKQYGVAEILSKPCSVLDISKAIDSSITTPTEERS